MMASVSGVKRKRSIAWDYFIKLEEDIAQCEICGDKIKISIVSIILSISSILG